MRNGLLLCVLLCWMTLSCKKDSMIETTGGETETQVNEEISVADVKNWFKAQQNTPEYKRAQTAESPGNFSIAQLEFDLDSLRSFKAGSGNVQAANTNGHIRKNGIQYGYRKLVFFKDSLKQIHFRTYVFSPDLRYLMANNGNLCKKFTGDVLIFNEQNHLIGGAKLVNAQQVAVIRPVSKVIQAKEKGVNLAISVCTTISDLSVSIGANGMYEVHYYYYTTCSTIRVPDGGERIPDFGDGGGGFGGGGGGNITNYPPPSPPLSPAVLYDQSDKVDPKEMVKCFGNISNENATYSVKVLVQQAWPGTTSPVGGNTVGHTALALTKTGADGESITQVVGFYPSNHSQFTSQGEVHNNSNLSYNVGLTFSVDAASFGNVLNYIAAPEPPYNLYDFNCTTWAISACITGGIQLPSATTTYSFPVTNGDGTSGFAEIRADIPGKLGENIKAQNPTNMDNGGTGPSSHGPC
jgi:hypothetical protein